MSDNIPEDWQVLLAEHQRRLADGRAMGGEVKLQRRSDAGKPNIRQMIDQLVDPGSFLELGTLVGGMSYHGETTAAADALVGGIGQINRQQVIIAGEDFTTMGGSIGHGTAAKKLRLASLALQERIPFVTILEGSGERTTNALDRRANAPGDLQLSAKLSGRVPSIAIVSGPSAGHGALTGMLTDFIIMTEDACMFTAGPPLVEAALGEKVSKEELGGASLHTSRSGVAHNRVENCDAAFQLARQYLGFMPASAWHTVAKVDGPNTAERRLDSIFDLIPADDRVAYDMRKLIALLADDAEQCLEFQPGYGRSIITSFLRLGGHTVACVANQPTFMAGSITAEAAEKASHFISLCNAYHLPVVFLADNPGVMSGSAAEQAGTLRAAARMYAAQSALQSPKLHVTIRKAFGFGSSLMGMNPFDQQTLSLAFPGITLGGIPALSGGSAAKVDEDTATLLKRAERSGAWATGDTMAYDEIIDPRECRNYLLRGLHMSAARASLNPEPVAIVGVSP
ncbi:MAG: acyl-CoA carboxylase subunit beta [Pseudomonadales bacterium]